MKSLKKIMALGLTITTLFANSTMTVNACPCGANCNCADKTISTTLNSSYYSYVGNPEYKNNDHSVYFKFCYNDGTNGVHLQVIGSLPKKAGLANSNQTMDRWGNLTTFVVIPPYCTSPGTQWQIYNGVYENNFAKCQLKVSNRSNQEKATLKALWSPDLCKGYGGSYALADDVESGPQPS